MASEDPSVRSRALKPLVFVAALAPAVVMGFRFATDRYGANPIAEVLNDLGLVTLITLLATLACTPLNIGSAWAQRALGRPRQPGWAWPLQVRRMLGLFAFFYVTAHLAIYVALDQGFDWDEIGRDIVKRKFITVGFAAFVILVPLALTSTQAMVRRLGHKTWKRLHRLVYVAAILGIIHFVWREKVPGPEQWSYASALAVLLLVRFVPKPSRVQASSP